MNTFLTITAKSCAEKDPLKRLTVTQAKEKISVISLE